MALAVRGSLPLSICVESATPHEVKLVEKTFDSCFVKENPKKVIGDAAYDSDPLDVQMKEERDIDIIAPHRSNRKKIKTQDGRPLRRYKRRWHVERLFAWLQNFRRVVTRWDYYEENFLGFVQLACMVILLRQF
jgi:transposase